MTTTACKTNIDAELYAKVKTKAKAEKITITSIVSDAFHLFLNNTPLPAAPEPTDDPVLKMLAERKAEAQKAQARAEASSDPEAAKTIRTEMALIESLRQAHAAAKAA